MYEEISLDCTNLESPEPLNLIIDNLSKLNKNSYIKMIHRMEPGLLFNILKQNNYEYKITYEKNKVIVYIWCKSFQDIENHIKTII